MYCYFCDAPATEIVRSLYDTSRFASEYVLCTTHEAFNNYWTEKVLADNDGKLPPMLARQTVNRRTWEFAELGRQTQPMTNDERAELHSVFYQKAIERISIEEMTYDQQVEWEEMLERIVIEAKASQHASQQVRREKQAKMSKEDRERLVTHPVITGSEALLIPKIRKERQTKADKVADDLAKLGWSPEQINEMLRASNLVSNSKVTVAEKVKEAFVPENTFTFNQNAKPNFTQENLLNDVMERFDYVGDSIQRVKEQIATAELLITKVNKERDKKGEPFLSEPTKLADYKRHLYRLENPPIVSLRSTIETQTETVKETFDPSKLFG